ncbi:hypothetical protein Tco_0263859, partial [Tanacetum coccineum]
GAGIDNGSLALTCCLGGASNSGRAPSSIFPSKPPLIHPYGIAFSLGSGSLVGDTCLLIEARVEDEAGVGARTNSQRVEIFRCFLPFLCFLPRPCTHIATRPNL